MSMNRLLVAVLMAALTAVACDQQGRPLEHPGMDRLQPGVSGELDVRGVFGVPETIIEQGDGSRVFQYPQGPEGPRTFFATIGADGKLIRVSNVLVPGTFAKIVPGISRDDVRRLIGRPGAEKAYPLKRQTAWEWKFIGDDHGTKVFYVTFDEANKVVSSGVLDPALSSGH
jgi:hypothetical protein